MGTENFFYWLKELYDLLNGGSLTPPEVPYEGPYVGDPTYGPHRKTDRDNKVDTSNPVTGMSIMNPSTKRIFVDSYDYHNTLTPKEVTALNAFNTEPIQEPTKEEKKLAIPSFVAIMRSLFGGK